MAFCTILYGFKTVIDWGGWWVIRVRSATTVIRRTWVRAWFWTLIWLCDSPELLALFVVCFKFHLAHNYTWVIAILNCNINTLRLCYASFRHKNLPVFCFLVLISSTIYYPSLFWPLWAIWFRWVAFLLCLKNRIFCQTQKVYRLQKFFAF